MRLSSYFLDLEIVLAAVEVDIQRVLGFSQFHFELDTGISQGLMVTRSTGIEGMNFTVVIERDLEKIHEGLLTYL